MDKFCDRSTRRGKSVKLRYNWGVILLCRRVTSLLGPGTGVLSFTPCLHQYALSPTVDTRNKEIWPSGLACIICTSWGLPGNRISTTFHNNYVFNKSKHHGNCRVPLTSRYFSNVDMWHLETWPVKSLISFFLNLWISS